MVGFGVSADVFFEEFACVADGDEEADAWEEACGFGEEGGGAGVCGGVR